MMYRGTLWWIWIGVTAIILVMIAVVALWNRERSDIAQRRIAEHLEARLVPLRNGIEAVFKDEAIRLTKLIEPFDGTQPTPEACAEVQANSSIDSLIVWNRKSNEIVFPVRIDHLSDERQASIRQGLKVLREDSQTQPIDESQSRIVKKVDTSSMPRWVAWYQDRRTWVGYVVPLNPNVWVMMIPPPTVWLGKIIVANNENFQLVASEALIQMCDAQGKVLHQGGSMELHSQARLASIPLTSPLETWSLNWYGNSSYRQRLVGDDPFWYAIVALISLAALLIAGAWGVSTSLKRQFVLAEQRVSFVNQVSHELRTPLTNICMYADLLENELKETVSNCSEALDANLLGSPSDQEFDLSSLHKIHVIREESHRLNRLIRNVLEFGRSNKRVLNPKPAVLDELIQQSLALFLPRFRAIGLEVIPHLAANQPAMLDVDVVEQILVNLLNNAEKYAVQGKHVWIQSSQLPHQVTFRVIDFGPGIPASEHARIFKPFYRLDDGISAPTGSGIGLAVAQELARLHGGDCYVEPVVDAEIDRSIRTDLPGVRIGACFRCDLAASHVVESLEPWATSRGASPCL